MSIIECQSLSLRIGSNQVLNHFDATIIKNEMIVILGPNGSGKSTFLRAILGLVKPTSGKIIILGEPAKRGHPNIGYMPQIRTTLHTSQLSARAKLAATLKGFQWGLPYLSQKEKSRIQETLRLVDAVDYADRPFSELSGGEQQRIAFAQALLNQPDILLLDEPLNYLDPNQQEKMMALIDQIRNQFNITVLITAHDVNPLLEITQRVIYLSNGKAAIGKVEDVINNEKLSWLYQLPIEVISHNNRLFVIHHKSGSNLHEHAHSHE